MAMPVHCSRAIEEQLGGGEVIDGTEQEKAKYKRAKKICFFLKIQIDNNLITDLIWW
jgi:hypothetical protein